MITTGASSDSTFKKGYTLVYMTYTSASRYLTGALDILLKLDPAARKIAIIHENDKFSTDVVSALKKYAEDKGLQVSMYEGYDSHTTDFAPFIDKIPQGVDAVMGGGHFLPIRLPSPGSSMKRGSPPRCSPCWWPPRSPSSPNRAKPAST
jgi:branched-chain amino acid transport system substrate-binding protein